MNKLTPAQCLKVVELRANDDPVTIANLAVRFNVSQRTIYYILSAWRQAEQDHLDSMEGGVTLYVDG